MNPDRPAHQVYPAAAQAILQRAAQTPITPDDPLARVKAIDKANRQVQQLFPQYFRKDIES